MKSYVLMAFTIYAGILKDATTRWSNLEASLEKDLSYLSKAVEARGLPFLTILLPAMAKSLLKWLDQGVMDVQDVPQGYPMHQKKPKLFGDFFDMIFDTQGRLRLDGDTEAIAFLYQLLSCCKNVELDCHPSRTKETLDEFFAIEENLPVSYPDTWDSDIPKWEPRYGHPLWGIRRFENDAQAAFPFDPIHPGSNGHDLPWNDLRAYARKIVHGWLGSIPDWELEPRHGPGAVSEGLRGDKYAFPNWPTKLENRFPYDWYGAGVLDHYSYPDHRERPSRLIAVPKSQKGPRLICAEPVAHQWIQQGIWRWLESRVKATPLQASINFRDQSISARRALSSSHSGELCTIDLSSASDRVSTRLVEYLFQGSNILDAMHACRTRTMVQNISADHPRMIVLRKFSTMGSAATFPVQTLVFYMLTTWALKLVVEAKGYEGPKWTAADVTIFGDDIIAPTVAYPTIKLVLHECGLKVNEAKTFTGSNFRESCGMYAFRGVDITPAYYLKPYDGSPSSLTTTVEMSNNFHLRGYWKTAEAIVSQIPEQELKKLLITDTGRTGGLGLVSYCGTGYHLHKKRWDPGLHSWYVKVLSVSPKTQMAKGPGESSLSQYFFENPNPEFPWESGRVTSVKQRKRLARVYVK
jgi:hypothetical protein